MAGQYGLPKKTPLSAGSPAVSPSSIAAHQILDQSVAEFAKKNFPQYASMVPPEKAKLTVREALKTANFMEKQLFMSKLATVLPKGVTPADIEKAVNEAPPSAAKPPAAPAAPAPAAAAPAAAPAAPAAAAAAPAAAPAPAAADAVAPPAASTPQPAVQAGAGPAAIEAAAAASRAAPQAGGGADHYRKMREPFAAELKDPATRRLLKGIISAENPGAGSAVAESLMNRTAMVNEMRAAKGQRPLTLKAMIQGDPSIAEGKSFYGPVRTGAVNEHLRRVDADTNYSAKLDSYITSALGGADTIKGHTDQGSKNDPNYDAGGVGVNINGERFNDWGYGGSRAWREKNQALASSGGSATEYPDPTPNVGAGESDYTAQAEAAAAKSMVDPTPNVGSGSGDYTPAATPVADASSKTDYGKGAGDIFSAMGDLFAKGPVAQNAARPSGPANLPIPILPVPPSVTPTVDPRVAQAQRQQLAMALQRLNSGKLV